MTRRAVRSGAAAKPEIVARRRPGRAVRVVLACPLLLLGIWLYLGRGAEPVPLADEAALLAVPEDGVHVFRLAPAPEVLVLTFPSLTEQARALNRIGAFVEKAGAPHSRVLTDPEMSALIEHDHETPENFYYGHDYRIADLERFFATAGAAHIPLHPEEQAVQQIVQREASARPPALALISLPPLSPAEQIDAPARAAILRHEISHGVYFTSPPYAAYTRHFWTQTLTPPERARFQSLLAAQGYDTTKEDLTANETQAYLVHTPDARYFSAAATGLPDANIARLRAAFVACMPPGWLRERTAGAEAVCGERGR